MFTGIVEEVGTIESVKRGLHSSVLKIRASKVLEDVHIGDSIAVSGVCLTVTGAGKEYFLADVMHETLNRSSLAGRQRGDMVNLERAMSLGGRFGGHIVSGHIDGTGVIADIKKDDIAVWLTIQAGAGLLRYIVEKGSVALDGVSLTVAGVTGRDFRVSMIPHTYTVTTFARRKRGDKVNIETDIIGKYVEKLLMTDKPSGITSQTLSKYGFL
ncbi:riboflavin synthase [Catenibacillus scindens]|uniref:Riboflavin synthase n=1 Tax=Catenibacillus scindens TaxID=673271 RepID=A0A7W8HBH3_9FIRM|nr:riboflavin synthase [Catenibacillus scindens]MBB5265294.1 riboflavin synthase [Catenibacillus scindens]